MAASASAIAPQTTTPLPAARPSALTTTCPPRAARPGQRALRLGEGGEGGGGDAGRDHRPPWRRPWSPRCGRRRRWGRRPGRRRRPAGRPGRPPAAPPGRPPPGRSARGRAKAVSPSTSSALSGTRVASRADAGVAGRREEGADQRGLGDLPGEGVLTAARAHDEDAHASRNLPHSRAARGAWTCGWPRRREPAPGPGVVESAACSPPRPPSWRRARARSPTRRCRCCSTRSSARGGPSRSSSGSAAWRSASSSRADRRWPAAPTCSTRPSASTSSRRASSPRSATRRRCRSSVQTGKRMGERAGGAGGHPALRALPAHAGQPRHPHPRRLPLERGDLAAHRRERGGRAGAPDEPGAAGPHRRLRLLAVRGGGDAARLHRRAALRARAQAAARALPAQARPARGPAGLHAAPPADLRAS